MTQTNRGAGRPSTSEIVKQIQDSVDNPLLRTMLDQGYPLQLVVRINADGASTSKVTVELGVIPN